MASLRDVVEATLAQLQLDLEELTQAKAGSRTVLRITVDGDGAQGQGLSLDEVAAASRAISQALDDTGVMGERAYVLEVGTRGVDRPLTRPAHWRRNRGRLVEITRANGERTTARIIDSDAETVALSDGLTVPYSEITRAVVQVEMNRDDEEEE